MINISLNDNMFGKNLKKLRIETGASQTTIAAKLGLQPAQVSKYEAGASKPDIHKLLTICEYFNVTPNEILLGEGQGRVNEDKEGYGLKNELEKKQLHITHLDRQLSKAEREISGLRQHVVTLQKINEQHEIELSKYTDDIDGSGKKETG